MYRVYRVFGMFDGIFVRHEIGQRVQVGRLFFCSQKLPVTSTYLCREDDQRYADHDYHVQLRRPNVRHEVAVANRGECYHHVVSSLEQAQVTMPGPLKVLYAAYAVTTQKRDRYKKKKFFLFLKIVLFTPGAIYTGNFKRYGDSNRFWE